MTHDMDRQFEANHNRRMANQARIDYAKHDRRDAEAEALIGELCKEGRRVFYINVKSAKGAMTGRIVEFGHKSDAIHYLIRNRYV
jgi:hypothetical protein